MQIDAADALAVSGWVAFLEQLSGLLMASVRCWVEACAAAPEGDAGADARAAADSLPGPRLLCDSLFMHDMREVRGVSACAYAAPCSHTQQPSL